MSVVDLQMLVLLVGEGPLPIRLPGLVRPETGDQAWAVVASCDARVLHGIVKMHLLRATRAGQADVI